MYEAIGVSNEKRTVSTHEAGVSSGSAFFRVGVSVDGLWRALVRILPIVLLLALLGWNLFLIYMLATEVRMNDFGRFYYSALAFLQGHDMYGPRPVEFAQLPELQLGKQFGNMNPPHFHLVVLPLAFFPPLVALGGWGILSGLCLFLSLKVISQESTLVIPRCRWWLVALGFLSFTGTQMMLITGQLAWVLFLPVTLAWAAARHGRWPSAGGYVGVVMSVKPFLLIFLPYFVLQRQWRAVITAGVTLLGCFVVGVMVFGVEAYRSWLATLAAVNWTLGDTNVSLLGFLTRVFSANAMFSSLIDMPGVIRPLWLLIAGFIGALTFAVSTWSRDENTTDRSFALLLLAALLISPLGWTYYLWFPLGPFTALWCSWWRAKRGAVVPPFSALQWRNWLLLAATPGLVWPFLATGFLQPHPWATVVFGSIYFWSTLFLWSALIIDWRVD